MSLASYGGSLTRRVFAKAAFVTAALVAMLAGCAQVPPAPETPAPPSPAPAAPPPPAPPKAAPAPAPPAPEEVAAHFTQRGRVSLYGKAFDGKKTASGEPFDPEALTMAHRTLPFGTLVRVTNLENHRSVDVKVNDRGPFVAGRIGDVSLAAARKLGMVDDGVIDAQIEVIRPPPAD
ncbi:MAG: septal ring lytic transglycosylase RlpA family protein [Rudaea sp.]